MMMEHLVFACDADPPAVEAEEGAGGMAGREAGDGRGGGRHHWGVHQHGWTVHSASNVTLGTMWSYVSLTKGSPGWEYDK